ncbi:MAG TPA: N-formylglutamate amidohydrolase [Croceibacterium sp.]|jgi:N-formylglutamate amidohydrolase
MVSKATDLSDSPGVRGGGIPGAPGKAAFTLTRREPSPIPVLIAVPHAGRTYPRNLLTQMRDPLGAGFKLEDRYVDLLARSIAEETGAGLLLAHAPRAMIDLNRAPEEMDWEMVADAPDATRESHGTARRARGGLGLVPRRLPGLGEIWKRRLTHAELDARLAAIHAPYHAALDAELAALKARWGAALLVDLHSMPPLGPKRGPHASADFVVGDRFGSSCDGVLIAAAFDHFAAAGWRAAHNRPYAGGYVLDRHAAPTRGFHGLQVEICRAAYLDERLREPGAGFDSVVALLTGLVRRLASEFASLGGTMRQAAE